MKNEQRVELLAPAGNFECLLAAFKAGADAVYLAGNLYGARAFAGNFSEEELLAAIELAHILGKKLYLTVNTLLKNNEISALTDYLRPYYEAGLDAVIVQDMGVVSVIRRNFPNLPIHFSTQTSLTSVYGAEFAKEMGASRIVPARELSLAEIKNIHKETDIELECFIHGAMCYCYSGDCLFSSMIGGRSGNRGRCAQPCRLSYSPSPNKEEYPLSLKDMNTIHILKDLIEAGISSFKIEGRMKGPEYVYGVTSIYRKYIDMYYRDGQIRLNDADLKILNNLYIRNTTSEGYYKRYNGRRMITMDKPGYNGDSDALIESIRQDIKNQELKLPVKGYLYFHKNEPAVLNLEFRRGERCFFATAEGNTVLQALNHPITEQDLRKQMNKLGDEPFRMDLTIEMDEDAFQTIGDINSLRREAFKNLHEIIKDVFKRECEQNDSCHSGNYTAPLAKENVFGSYDIRFMTIKNVNAFWEYAQKHDMSKLRRVYLPFGVYKDLVNKAELRKYFGEIFLILPRIHRERNADLYNEVINCLNGDAFDGLLVSNYDDLFLAQRFRKRLRICADSSIYTMNGEALSELRKYCDEFVMSYELSENEILGFHEHRPENMMVYGRIPLMVTANCVVRTYGLKECNQCPDGDFVYLYDRKKERIPVYHNCTDCGNIIYNSVPLSLHKHMNDRALRTSHYILSFTDEDKATLFQVMDLFLARDEATHKNLVDNFRFTNGHYNRGVD